MRMDDPTQVITTIIGSVFSTIMVTKFWRPLIAFIRGRSVRQSRDLSIMDQRLEEKSNQIVELLMDQIEDLKSRVAALELENANLRSIVISRKAS